MGKPRRDARPQRAADVLRLAAFLLALGLAVAVLLIAAGVFDPRPLGPLLRRDHPGIHALPATGEMSLPQSPPWPASTPPDRFSVRMTAALVSGETDSGYGLALGEAEQLLIAVSPTGYVAVREAKGGAPPTFLLPWQPWPHVRPGEQANEIWLDVARTRTGAEVTAWVNRERLWRGALDGPPDDVKLWLAGFDGPVSVDFQSLDWYTAP
jgi:hypothetical protein